MTEVSIESENLVINVKGADQIWSFKSQLTIPLAHIIQVEHKPEVARIWYHGIKAPGTSLPGVLTAGTFYRAGEKVFWDVHNPDKTIVITLKDESYQKLVIEVGDPAAAVELINSARK